MAPSIFDSDELSRRLFFPFGRESPAPARARDLTVAAADGSPLHLRFHDRAGRGPALLLFHGNGEVVADYDALAPAFTDAGADLAVVDYRGYGASAGLPTLRGLLEDAPRVLDAFVAAAPGRPVIVFGRSLGSLCAAELAGAPRAGVVAYVLESGLARLEGLVERRGLALEAPLSEADLAAFCPLRKVARATLPALVLHGAADTLIAPDEGRTLFQHLGSADKELALVERGGHNDLFSRPEYWTTLARFFARFA